MKGSVMFVMSLKETVILRKETIQKMIYGIKMT